MNKIEKDDYNELKEMYLRIEPYHYMERYVVACEHYYIAHPLEMIQETNRSQTLIRFITMVKGAINHNLYKVVNLDDDIIPLLTDTKPNFDVERNLPFPFMFINKQIKIGDMVINGFMLSNCSDETNTKEIGVSCTMLNTKEEYETYATHGINENFTTKEAIGTDVPKRKQVENAKILRTIACNLIDLMTSKNEDVEMFEIKCSSEQNLKRIKRGQSPHRNKLVIRLAGFTKTYARYYSHNREKISVRFLVRGHWRRYYDERYNDELRGTKRWIYPYFKGQEHPDEIKKFIELRCHK